jgi:hypothetical protein
MMRYGPRAIVGAAALGAALLAAPIPARADGEYLKITPNTIRAGFHVDIEGFCGGDKVNAATVKSDAFGVVTITPRQSPRTGLFLHRGTATVPADKKSKTYRVVMTCPNGRSATATLHVVNFNIPARGPKTGGGALAEKSAQEPARTPAQKLLGDNGLALAGVGSVALGSLLLVRQRKPRA